MSHRNLRFIIAAILYVIIATALINLGFNFTGFFGLIKLFLLGFGLHALVDFGLHKLKKKKKENDANV
jgi:hypothetical protein